MQSFVTRTRIRRPATRMCMQTSLKLNREHHLDDITGPHALNTSLVAVVAGHRTRRRTGRRERRGHPRCRVVHAGPRWGDADGCGRCGRCSNGRSRGRAYRQRSAPGAIESVIMTPRRGPLGLSRERLNHGSSTAARSGLELADVGGVHHRPRFGLGSSEKLILRPVELVGIEGGQLHDARVGKGGRGREATAMKPGELGKRAVSNVTAVMTGLLTPTIIGAGRAPDRELGPPRRAVPQNVSEGTATERAPSRCAASRRA